MTAAKKKPQRAPEEGEPNSGKLPEGTPGEPPADSEPPSDDLAEPTEEPVPEVKAPAPAAPEVKKSEAPSFFARLVNFLMTDLDGN